VQINIYLFTYLLFFLSYSTAVEPQGLMAFLSNTDKLYSSCVITVLYKCWLVFMQPLVLVKSIPLMHLPDLWRVINWRYRGGSPTAVQAWQPCPL